MLTICISGVLKAQTDTVTAKINKLPHIRVDALAKFPGGDFSKYIAANIDYEKKVDKNIHGQVIISMRIDTTGTVSLVNVLQSMSPDIDREVVHVIKSSPRWRPAMLNGKAVGVYMVFNIDMGIKGTPPPPPVPPANNNKAVINKPTTTPAKKNLPPIEKKPTPPLAQNKPALKAIKKQVPPFDKKPVPIEKKPAPQIAKKATPVVKKPVQPVVAKKTVSLPVIKKPVPPVVAKKIVPPVIKKPAPPVIAKKVVLPPIVKKTTPPVIAKKTVPAPVIKKPVPPIVTKKTIPPPVIKKPAPPVVAKKVVLPVVAKPTPPVVAKKITPLVITKPAAPVIAKKIVPVPVAQKQTAFIAKNPTLTPEKKSPAPVAVIKKKKPLAKRVKKADNDDISTLGRSAGAEFPGGGRNGFFQYLNENIHYPILSKLNKIEGVVEVSFIVDKDGIVKDAKIISAPAEDLADEALRVILASPKWIPAMQNGMYVKEPFTENINFKLQDKPKQP